ncbi:GntR family transcriptional regulator [Roseovarius sp. SK2]|uniref:GntR family transcriptional regulator n=1 Tax=Roseovarius sp. SK2 TaxID=3028381 RepID=UPI00237B4874|nr:GntR family transcriptional regulator [Roseovarius sp. SK2]MDD9725386.1 GntR family transcriptional regulator [Roseovarius sp. SK2]
MRSKPNDTEDFIDRYWNDDSNQPKHERLKQAFTLAIAEGFWLTGMRLPTEAELARYTPCSLGTVQRALRGLSSDGLIDRRRGSGSVVVDLDGRLSDPWHIRYVAPQDSPDKYLELHTRIVSRKEVFEQGPWNEELGETGGSVTKIDRIFALSGGINVYSEFYALTSRFPEFLELPQDKLNGLNFKKLIAAKYKSPTQKVRQRLSFVPTPDHVAQSCGIPAGGISPVLNVLSFPLIGEAIYYQDFYLPMGEGVLDLGFAIRTA